MIRLLRLEWRKSLPDRLLWLAVILLTALLAAAAFNGGRDTGAARTAIAETNAHESRRIDELKRTAALSARGEKLAQYAEDGSNPTRVGGGDGARRAWLPPADFASFAEGYSRTLPQSHRVTTWSRHTRTDGYALSSPFGNATGRFDFAFVCVLLLPLFALALGYNVVSADRESGTLRLAGAQPVSLGRLIAARLAIRFALLTAPLLATGTILYFWSAQALTPVGMAQWLALALALCLYVGFWLALCGVINTLGRGSPFNAISAVALYLVFTVLVPTAAQFAAAGTRPVPDRMALVGKMRAIDAETTQRLDGLMKAYYQANPGIAPANEDALKREFRIRLFPKNVEFDRRLIPLLALRAEATRAQFAIVRIASFASPPLALNLILEQWAGNDLARNLEFERQVDDYQRQWRAFFGPRIMAFVRVKPDDYDRLPAFVFAEEPAASFWTRSLIPSSALSLASAILIALCALRLARENALLDG